MHMLAHVNKITDLSFVESKQNLWAPTRTGDYAVDVEHGRRCADELLTYMRIKEDALPYSQVTRAITEGGKYDAVEIGFCSRIGILLFVGPAQECAKAMFAGVRNSPVAFDTGAAETTPAPVF